MTAEESKPSRIAIVAGMPRAATTFLYHTLANHPNAWVPPRKELEYFSLNFDRGEEWYNGFFSGAAAGQVGFDISPIYFMDPGAPTRIRAWRSDAKVILIVRDPVEFVLSFYANRRGASSGPLEFADFLAGHTYIKDGQQIEFVFRDGRIARTIEQYCSLFGSDLLLASYDLMRRDPLEVLRAIEAFVGLEPYFTAHNFDNVRVNASDQRNIVWLNRLMHHKWFADAVVRLVPKSIILRARYWVQTRRTGAESTPSEVGTAADRDLAERRLESDRAYVAELFREADLRLGSGAFTSPEGLRGSARAG